MSENDQLPAVQPERSKGFMIPSPRTIEEAMLLAETVAKSDIVPKQYKGKPGDTLVAMMLGSELGLNPIQALQNIAVINGRPSLWGDSALALVKAHAQFGDCIETFDAQTMTATCIVKRKGKSDVTSVFSQKDAETAKLWKKEGPWTNYPKRMLQMRARGFALRDQFPDALAGLVTAEEAGDMPTEQVDENTTRGRVEPQKNDLLPEYTEDQYQLDLPAMTKSLANNKATHASILGKLKLKWTIPTAFEEKIKALPTGPGTEKKATETPAQDETK